MAKSRSAPPTSAQKRLAAERAAAARERIETAQRRRRLTVIGTAIGAIIVVVAVLVVVKVVLDTGPKSGQKTTQAQQSVAAQVAGVPASVFNEVGVGSTSSPPTAVNGQTPLTAGGKPRVLYVGAEFCPYCAAERWPVAVALSRFGTFQNLGQTRSSPSDTNPNTATLSFHGSTYSSKYLAFTGKELQSNQVVGNTYGPLDQLSPADEAVFKKDAKGYPFLDIGGKYILNAAQYDGSTLAGKNQQQIAAALSQPNSAISKDVIGSANVLTARFCQLTKNQPANVCTSAGVTAAAKALANGNG